MASKGVEDCVLSRISKLDDGLVADRDGVNLTENGVWSSVVVRSDSMVGCLFEKRPELSLVCPLFVVASIADYARVSIELPSSESFRGLVLMLRVFKLKFLVAYF